MNHFFSKFHKSFIILFFAAICFHGISAIAITKTLNDKLSNVYINPPDNPDLPNILIIGDSIARDYYGPVQELLKRKADVFLIPTNAKHTSYGVENVEKWLVGHKWDIIHFNWGLHDIAYRNPQSKNSWHLDKVDGNLTTSASQYTINLENIVEKLKKTNAKLIWCTTTPVPNFEPGRYKGDEVKYNLIAEKIMIKNGIIINDLYSYALLRVSDILKGNDDVHYTPEGHKYLAKKVAQELLLQL